MSDVVEWVLNLKDQFTHVLKNAKEKTEEFEKTADHAKEHASSMLSSLGIGFALFQGWDFLKSSKEQFEQLETSNSQLEAGLESTKGVAGLTFEGLQQSAVAASDKLKFTQAQIEDMQAVMLTFPAVTKRTFGDATQAIEDMATRLHQDLDSTAIQVGKALQDPIKGVTALRRVGVNFNEAQTEMIQKMVQGGHAAQAQAYILKELQTEFGGSAEAAAKADVAFRFNKSWEEIKFTVGDLANNFMKKLAPALEWVAAAFQNVTKWMKEHKEVMSAIEDILLPVVAVILSIAAATRIWAAVQWLLNAAMAANPLVMLIMLIAAAVGAVIYCYNHFAKFRAVLWGVWETVKEFGRIVADVFTGLWHIIHGVFTLSASEIKLGSKESVDAIANAGQRLGSAFKKGFDAGMSDFAKDQAADPNEKAGKAAKIGKAVPAGAPTGPVSTSPGNKVSGQKIQTFNISINGGLVHQMTFNTQNITESAGRIKEAVARALTSAVNDSQIIGDH